MVGEGQEEPQSVPEALRRWLEWTVQVEASDLHLVAGHPPMLRLHGELTEMPEPPLEAAALEPLLLSLCSPEQAERLSANRNVDFAVTVALGQEVVRLRAALFHAGRQLAACFRLIPSRIPDLAWAGFPAALADRLCALRDGLVIVTGATGSGKTTTLAMLVDRIHALGGRRILTVEEPVEYLFPRRPHSLVTQREVGVDVLSFADGLKYGLRQDPDVLLIGEVRDRETAQMVLSAAETGHLVFTTLHTRDAKGAITRLADLFAPEVQSLIRAQLAMSLRAILSQRLLPGLERGSRRVLALEVLWNTHPIASAIRSGKIESIDNYILTGREEGMITFDESIRQLFRAGRITRRTAEEHMADPTLLQRP
jgi:twitching motility protein PilT